jgi:amidase
VGVVVDSFTGVVTDAETRAAVLGTAELLSALGHHVEETTASATEGFDEDFALYWG